MSEIQELREIVQAQAKRVTVLTRLVERMGRNLAEVIGAEFEVSVGHPYTIIGQREYDAAMHDAEGPDVRREDCVP